VHLHLSVAVANGEEPASVVLHKEIPVAPDRRNDTPNLYDLAGRYRGRRTLQELLDRQYRLRANRLQRYKTLHQQRRDSLRDANLREPTALNHAKNANDKA
jgi:hypothetical protein